MRRSTKRIVIVGAGPIGLEAALNGIERGHDVRVFEQGSIGDNVARWGHVRFFSSFALNRSERGAGVLRESGAEPPSDDAYLTGGQFLDQYLAPLARSDVLASRVNERTRVVSIGRDRIGKRDLIGGPRQDHPFRVLTETEGGEELVEHADVILDCSGTYGNHNWMGNGNVPAIGERSLAESIEYTLPDVKGTERERYEGRVVLLVGDGHSAATALEGLSSLPGTTVHWVARKARPMEVIPDDPLPERARLATLANSLAAGELPSVVFHAGAGVEATRRVDAGFSVELSADAGGTTLRVDEIIALVGYSPDNGMYRELQVHECYASLAPMKLAAKLLGENNADCLAQTSGGVDVIRNPEPNFFILGAKSYGKGSNFLIRTGLEQIEAVFAAIDALPAERVS